MNVCGVHLTRIGSGDMLLEPSRALDIGNTGPAMESILTHLQRERSARLYYDLAEQAVIDEAHYAWLEGLARACRAINVQMVCIHMQPTAAFGLATFLKDKPSFDTALEMESRRRDD